MADYKIKLFNRIAKIGLDDLGANYDCREDLNDYQAIMVRSADLRNEEFPADLLAIARAGAGVNNIPLAKCSEAGIAVFNTPGANANAVKELVIAAMIIGSRNISTAVAWVNSLSGDDIDQQVESGKSQFVGCELYGKKLGVVGLGAVGVLVANASLDLGMKVYGYDPFLSIQAAWKLSRNVNYCNNIDDLIAKSDFVTLHLPFNESTKSFINSDNLQQMKASATLLNLARGGLVEDAAVLKALDDNQLSLYITDFANAEMIRHPKVVAFPHLGASTNESEDNCAVMAALQLKDFLENGNITNAVNLPNINLEKSGAVRIACFHRNIPNMIAQITKVIAHLNIENLTNKSKDDFAYTLVDVDDKLSATNIKDLQAIEGMLRVRVVYDDK